MSNNMQLDTQLRAALHVIADIIDSEGHLPSTEADFIFREAFCDFGETPKEALVRILTDKK